MAIESTSSTDVFIEADPDGDKLVLRYKTGSKWVKIHFDTNGNLIFTDNSDTPNVVTLTMATGLLSHTGG